MSLQDDIKLNESENAWKPTHLKKRPDMNDEERETNDVLSKFRSMLNKLTAENFDVLVEQVKTYKIDTMERLEGVSQDYSFYKYNEINIYNFSILGHRSSL